jgi:hypothetical protein
MRVGMLSVCMYDAGGQLDSDVPARNTAQHCSRQGGSAFSRVFRLSAIVHACY